MFRSLLLPTFTSIVYFGGIADCNEDSTREESFVVVKFGGSALTKKNEFETLNTNNLSKISDQIKRIHDRRLIFIHGAGSFGHFSAKNYKLAFGGDEFWLEGLAITRRSVTKLNGLVLDAFLAASIPAVSVSLFPLSIANEEGAINENRIITSAFNLLKLGFLPIFHGDVLIDNRNRCKIYSGDKILKWICQASTNEAKFNVKAAVFLTDVKGVFNMPPDDPEAKLVRKIIIENDGSISYFFDENESYNAEKLRTSKMSHDVTGGIKGKVEVAIEIAQLGIPVYIVEAGTEHSFQALQGLRPKVGTEVIRRS